MTADYVKACEDALKEHRAYNDKRNILPSHNAIIDRLLDRQEELVDAYENIASQVRGPQALQSFFDALLCISAEWTPEKVAATREGRTKLRDLNDKIVDAAEELIAMLEERDRLNAHSGFHSDTHTSIRDILEAAATDTSHDPRRFTEALECVEGEIDSTYWPPILACLQVIADDAEDTPIHPSNPTTAAATTGKRKSASDYLKALDHRLKAEARSIGSPLPSSRVLSDKAVASLANVALNRPAKRLFMAEYVKNWRQRGRKAAAAKQPKATA